MNERFGSQSDVIRSVRRLHRSGEGIWSRRIRETHPSLFSAAIYRFGSYGAAVRAAGIDYQRVQRTIPGRWNRKTIVSEIRKLHRAGEPLHYAAMERNHAALALAMYRYFGTYSKAFDAAGLSYEKVRVREMPTWDCRKVVDALKAHRKRDGGLWPRAIVRSNSYLVRAAVRCFGSYTKAAQAAGIPKKELVPPGFRKWSPELVVSELQRIYKSDPRKLKPAKMMRDEPKLLRASRKRFGTYAKACAAAGIDYASIARVQGPTMTAEDVIKKIKILSVKGEDLRYAAMERKHATILNAARNRFGTYEKAIRKAGLSYPPIVPLRHWTERLVIKSLRAMNKRGVDLRFRYFKAKHLPLFEAARYYFGTYLNALRVARIDYDDVVRRHLKRGVTVG